LTLNEIYDRKLDHLDSKLNIWQKIENRFIHSRYLNLYIKASSLPLLGYFFKKMAEEELFLIYDITTAFIHQVNSP